MPPRVYSAAGPRERRLWKRMRATFLRSTPTAAEPLDTAVDEGRSEGARRPGAVSGRVRYCMLHLQGWGLEQA